MILIRLINTNFKTVMKFILSSFTILCSSLLLDSSNANGYDITTPLFSDRLEYVRKKNDRDRILQSEDCVSIGKFVNATYKMLLFIVCACISCTLILYPFDSFDILISISNSKTTTQSENMF